MVTESSIKMTKNKSIDYHAKLIVHDPNGLSNKNKRRLSRWLLQLSKDLALGSENYSVGYSKVFTARLMK